MPAALQGQMMLVQELLMTDLLTAIGDQHLAPQITWRQK